MTMDDEFCVPYIGRYYDLLKFGSFVLVFSSIVALIGVHFLCPLRSSRKMFMKKLLKVRQKQQQKKKKRRRNLFDTRSISANTEFDFTAISASENFTNEGEQYITPPRAPSSFLNNTDSVSKHKRPATPPDRVIFQNGAGFKTLPRNTSQESNPVDICQTQRPSKNNEQHKKNDISVQQTTKPLISVQKSTSFGNLSSHGTGNNSSSRGQLTKDRKTSVVTFEMDKTRQNKYNTIATEKHRARKTANLNYNRENNSLLKQQRSSSSQDLVLSSGTERCVKYGTPKKEFRRYSTSTDVLDFQKRALVSNSNFGGKNATSDVHLEHTPSPFDQTKDAADDEGQMQCVFQFDLTRSILKVKELKIQAVFPPGVPGFIVEINLEPRTAELGIRSKVYVTVEQKVDVGLDDVFQLQCTKEQVERCSAIISVIPIFGNMVLLAETELNELNLIKNGEIVLGGLFKGIYTNDF